MEAELEGLGRESAGGARNGGIKTREERMGGETGMVDGEDRGREG